MSVNRLSILGVGLLGGSIGLAVRSVGMSCEITGYGHRQGTLDRALNMGAIDRATADAGESVADSDLIILCTPVGSFRKILREIGPKLKLSAIVTDVGSTKRSVVHAAEQALPRGARFVGSHPMAGSEKRGVEYARADLFRGARCIVTPTPKTDTGALAEVENFWRAIGMSVVRLSPEEHDRLICDISHLPHAVAAALVDMQDDEALALAGMGFLDSTRVAGGDGGLWRDIFLDNADNVTAAIDRLRSKLEMLSSRLKAGQGEELKAWLDVVAARRAKLLTEKLKELEG